VESEHHPVLVVEDDADLCCAVVLLLESSGYEAVGVADGRQAFDLLQHGLHPRMILLDLSMPEMNGEQFRLIQLRHRRLASIPVVIFSARPDAQEVARSLHAPAVLEKPIDADVLLHAVEEHATAWPRP
jgi:CheY-like chemotaxis protein